MSRVEQFEGAALVDESDEYEDNRDLRLWLKAGTVAKYFCLWSAMVIPILLIIDIRW